MISDGGYGEPGEEAGEAFEATPLTDDPAAFCACSSVRKAARAVTQLYDAALKPSGLRATQFTILLAISRSQAAPLSRLAESLVMDRTTLTRNLRPLEQMGLIRSRIGKDRRAREILLTDEGRQTLDRAIRYWRNGQAQMAEGLGTGNLLGLLTEMDLVVAVARGRRDSAVGRA